MRLRPFLYVLGLALLPGAALAQKVTILEARVGLPPGKVAGERDETGQAAYVLKPSTWAPVYVKLEMGEKPFTDPAKANAFLHVETVDGDGVGINYRIGLGSLADRNPKDRIEPGEFPHMPYVRMNRYGDVTLTVRSADGSRLSEPYRVGSARDLDPASFVVLSLGTKLNTFNLKPIGTGVESGSTRGFRGGRVIPASCIDPMQMPDHFFGYNAVDLVVLPTGMEKSTLLDALFGDASADPKYRVRRDALLEWVRRGGKLLISAGTNADRLAQYQLLQEFMATPLVAADPKKLRQKVPLAWQLAGYQSTMLEAKKTGDKVPLAHVRLANNRTARTLMTATDPTNAAAPDLPIVTTWNFGMGKVTFVAFDLDRSPFADNSMKDDFWDWIVRQATSEKTFLGDSIRNTNSYGYDSKEDKFNEALRNDAEQFDGVPVISFGWVALFIALYTLLIGPIEYFFLKKVLKRLELTWITFPIIVISVSAIAYFTAYAIKGSDLRINKVDVIDVDPASGRIYGRTWLSVFSPRYDNYTVGFEPNKGWVPDADSTAQPEATVDWMAGGTSGTGEMLLRSSYSNNVDASNRRFADGLKDVPIQVWSVKCFESNWSYRTGNLVESKLYHPVGAPQTLAGEFTCNLPVGPLKDAVAMHAGKVYKIGAILPGKPVKLTLQPNEESPQWLQTAANLVTVKTAQEATSSWNQSQQYAGTGNVPLWGMLFHEAAIRQTGGTLSNASLRILDQSWRLTPENKDEVLILAKLDPATGNTEDIFNQADSPSPNLLWLKGLPGEGKPRTPVRGTIRQETYIRILLPVKPAPKP